MFGQFRAFPAAMTSPREISKKANSDQVRAILEAKLAELNGGFDDRSSLFIENSADMLDTVRMALDRDIVVQCVNASTRTLLDIRSALDALSAGTYGICEDCGEVIPARRLAAIPWARFCLSCRERRDRRGVAAKDPGEFPLAA